jgi:hypothetical protein
VPARLLSSDIYCFSVVLFNTIWRREAVVAEQAEAEDTFAHDLQVLTGYLPLTWQRRMFDRLRRGDIPEICDLPTGLGKTNIIHLWFLALRSQKLEKRPRAKSLPTRLVYVVDRRTVVDQATALAEAIKKKLIGLDLEEGWLSVSTLRGQYADNRDWTIDPSRPAIIIGTVDMIGTGGCWRFNRGCWLGCWRGRLRSIRYLRLGRVASGGAASVRPWALAEG